MSAPVGCRWTVTSAASWIAIQGNASGTGNGTVTLAIAASTEPAERTIAVNVGEKVFMITQAGY